MASKASRAIHLVCSATVALGMLLLLGVGYGPVPALGQALVPGGGVWDSAGAETTVSTETLTLPGLDKSVKVSFTAEGYTSIEAGTDHDLFLAQGYVTARLRFTQLDLQRRLGQGRLSELVGAAGLKSDKFELGLGVLRTAHARWAATPRNSAAGKALVAYSAGVNSWMSHLEKTGDWPTIYGLTGVRPRPWTPTDTLVVQGVLTQQMDFNTIPLDYELLQRSLGAKRTMDWFPVQAPTTQSPYDRGPYKTLSPTPPTVPNSNAADPATTSATASTPSASRSQSRSSGSQDVALPDTVRQLDFNSNAWAANGPKVAGGGAMLAGDPHLQTTLPSYWLEMALRSPGYQVAGGSIPGVPGVLVGRNEHISWSLTNAQTVGTLFYREKVAADRPGSYYWNGAWRPMQKVHYSIPVRGGPTVALTTDLTVHGPMMTVLGRRVSVTWMGNFAHNDLNALLTANRAHDFASFREALRGWKAPALNFMYADDGGHIGTLLAGDVPQTPKGSQPWLPLSGTGEEDVVGTIPYDALPKAYDPPGHVIASTNQRQTGQDYPYYLGTSMYFDPGYRQSVIERFHSGQGALDLKDYTALQNDVTDDLAVRLVPKLLSALGGTKLTGQQRAARDLLTTWNHSMDTDSAAASVWWTFLASYLHEVFQPWWDAKKVPASKDRWILDLDRSPTPLREVLEHWTLDDPDNTAFTPPNAPRRDATAAMRTAFGKAVAELADKHGSNPSAWTWGKLHTREIPSITGAAGLGYEPYAAGGDPWTVNAAGGLLHSSFGPSFRLLVHWTGPATGRSVAIYPGGQSDTPTASWYDNLVPLWREKKYLPLDGRAEATATWTLRAGD
ncbi:penicillin acylase family protein [Streptomyces sp. NPDC001537]